MFASDTDHNQSGINICLQVTQLTGKSKIVYLLGTKADADEKRIIFKSTSPALRGL